MRIKDNILAKHLLEISINRETSQTYKLVTRNCAVSYL